MISHICTHHIMKIRFTLFSLVLVAAVLLRCNDEKPRPITHFIDLEQIRKVEISNVKGKHVLKEKQLQRFLVAFSKCSTEPGLAIKTGSLTLIFTMADGQTYVARGDSESDYLEISAEFAMQNRQLISGEWLVLNTNGVNFHNF